MIQLSHLDHRGPTVRDSDAGGRLYAEVPGLAAMVFAGGLPGAGR